MVHFSLLLWSLFDGLSDFLFQSSVPVESIIVADEVIVFKHCIVFVIHDDLLEDSFFVFGVE